MRFFCLFYKNKESEVFQQQQRSHSSPKMTQNDVIDEIFYREIEERAKKADQERREIARRARDNFHQNSLQLNVCFDTDNHTTILLQPPPLNLSKKITNEKKIHIELVDKKSPIIPNLSVNDLKKATIEQEQSPFTIIENYQS